MCRGKLQNFNISSSEFIFPCRKAIRQLYICMVTYSGYFFKKKWIGQYTVEHHKSYKFRFRFIYGKASKLRSRFHIDWIYQRTPRRQNINKSQTVQIKVALTSLRWVFFIIYWNPENHHLLYAILDLGFPRGSQIYADIHFLDTSLCSRGWPYSSGCFFSWVFLIFDWDHPGPMRTQAQ